MLSKLIEITSVYIEFVFGNWQLRAIDVLFTLEYIYFRSIVLLLAILTRDSCETNMHKASKQLEAYKFFLNELNSRLTSHFRWAIQMCMDCVLSKIKCIQSVKRGINCNEHLFGLMKQCPGWSYSVRTFIKVERERVREIICVANKFIAMEK